jgi:hypothetical protein
VSDLQYLLVPALLAGLLIVREVQHQKLVRALIDKILVKQGLEPLEPSFTETLIEKLTPGEDRTPYNQPKVPTRGDEVRRKETVHFKIPGMDVMEAMARQRDKQ